MTTVLMRADSGAREELRARLMALVLAAVLVWYTLVVPPYAPAPGRASLTPDDEGLDGEVRGAGAKGRQSESGISNPAAAAVAPAEELDWPEYIGLG